MIDIKQLALKHGMAVSAGGNGYWDNIAQLESLLAEYLVLSSSEPLAYILRNEYNEYRLEPIEPLDIKSLPIEVEIKLFKANPFNQALLKSHKRLCGLSSKANCYVADVVNATKNKEQKLPHLMLFKEINHALTEASIVHNALPESVKTLMR